MYYIFTSYDDPVHSEFLHAFFFQFIVVDGAVGGNKRVNYGEVQGTCRQDFCPLGFLPVLHNYKEIDKELEGKPVVHIVKTQGFWAAFVIDDPNIAAIL